MIEVTANPLIRTPFGFSSTAAEVIEGVDLSGRRAVVTGATSGIGRETARALASAGAEVTIPARDPSSGERVAAEIASGTGNREVHAGRLDLAELGSVAAFAESWTGPLHLLVNNAGVMHLPERQLSPEGVEMQFATNHLGHFALALGLHDALATARSARIVSVSSRAHYRSPVVFEDISFRSRPYDPLLAYSQSKTANILFAVEATRRWSGDGITANAVLPGAILDTNLARHMPREQLDALLKSRPYKLKTIEQGAATSVLVATSPQLEGIGGRTFDDCNESAVIDPATASSPPMAGVATYAIDPKNAARLWRDSLELLATPATGGSAAWS